MWLFLLDVRLFELCDDVRLFVLVRIGEKVSDGFGVCCCAFLFFGRVQFGFFDGVVLRVIGMVFDGMLLVV